MIERGGILFVRNDIIHRGCEHVSDYKHHRIYYLFDPACLNDSSDGNLNVIVNAFDDAPFFDKTTNKFVNRFK